MSVSQLSAPMFTVWVLKIQNTLKLLRSPVSVNVNIIILLAADKFTKLSVKKESFKSYRDVRKFSRMKNTNK